ncbi:polymorphic toxin type 50 domain-containing protein [Weissella minor]|uniref:polymorphic toxin type 50 domain-containing protein n=1 Tax=Weissella minor TaxID=1620 RepID=UPI0007112756
MDIQELLYKYAGTGKLRESTKRLANVESILNVPVHGVIIEEGTGIEKPATGMKIHYSTKKKERTR